MDLTELRRCGTERRLVFDSSKGTTTKNNGKARDLFGIDHLNEVQSNRPVTGA